MTQKWFVGRAGKSFGPYTWDEIVRLCQSGNVTTEDYLSDSTGAGWRRAVDIPALSGLFPAHNYSSPSGLPSYGEKRSKTPLFIVLGILGLGIIVAAIIFIPQLLNGTEVQTADGVVEEDSSSSNEGNDYIEEEEESDDDQGDFDTPLVDDGFVMFSELGLYIVYPDSIASALRVEEVEAEEDFIGATPRHRVISFDNYPISEAFYNPTIMVFPLEDYKQASTIAADEIAQLELIVSKTDAPQTNEILPFLPEQMAGQIFTANITLLKGESSSGLRYLTQYGQDIWPITNETLIYTYQGLSSDGQHYISAILPITHPTLPADSDEYFELTSSDYSAFDADYLSYLSQMITMIDYAAANDFLPSLEKLDEMIQSLVVEPF